MNLDVSVKSDINFTINRSPIKHTTQPDEQNFLTTDLQFQMSLDQAIQQLINIGLVDLDSETFDDNIYLIDDKFVPFRAFFACIIAMGVRKFHAQKAYWLYIHEEFNPRGCDFVTICLS